MGLKPITVTIHFPSTMDITEDRARWYINHAIRGYWQSFVHTDTDPIRLMGKCALSVPMTFGAQQESNP